MRRGEPLTVYPNRTQWIEDEAARTALSHQSYIANNLNVATVGQIQKKENIILADADGGGTIDKSEFAELLKMAGGDSQNAQEMATLFAAIDKDGDGELTEEEIAKLSEFKKKHALNG